jgi:hypothetical protein
LAKLNLRMVIVLCPKNCRLKEFEVFSLLSRRIRLLYKCNLAVSDLSMDIYQKSLLGTGHVVQIPAFALIYVTSYVRLTPSEFAPVLPQTQSYCISLQTFLSPDCCISITQTINGSFALPHSTSKLLYSPLGNFKHILMDLGC